MKIRSRILAFVLSMFLVFPSVASSSERTGPVTIVVLASIIMQASAQVGMVLGAAGGPLVGLAAAGAAIVYNKFKDNGGESSKDKGHLSDPEAKAQRREEGRKKVNSMNIEIARNRAPRGVKRVDPGDASKGTQPHVHFTDGTSLNIDGTTHDKKNGTPRPQKEIQAWLHTNGWSLAPEGWQPPQHQKMNWR